MPLILQRVQQGRLGIIPRHKATWRIGLVSGSLAIRAAKADAAFPKEQIPSAGQHAPLEPACVRPHENECQPSALVHAHTLHECLRLVAVGRIQPYSPLPGQQEAVILHGVVDAGTIPRTHRSGAGSVSNCPSRSNT